MSVTDAHWKLPFTPDPLNGFSVIIKIRKAENSPFVERLLANAEREFAENRRTWPYQIMDDSMTEGADLFGIEL